MKTYYMDRNGKVSIFQDEAEALPETTEELMNRVERAAGCRIDSNGFQNRAVGALMATMSRALGTNPHPPELDVLVGDLIRYQVSPAGQEQQRSREALSGLLRAGVGPEDILSFGRMLEEKG